MVWKNVFIVENMACRQVQSEYGRHWELDNAAGYRSTCPLNDKRQLPLDPVFLNFFQRRLAVEDVLPPCYLGASSFGL
jgi:hypothetical protein